MVILCYIALLRALLQQILHGEIKVRLVIVGLGTGCSLCHLQTVVKSLFRTVHFEQMPSLTCPLLQAPELCSTATSPLKTLQEEQNQALTPPGKGLVTGVRSPSCGRQQASVRGARLNPGNAGTSGIYGSLSLYS